jgi:ABC-type phosphate transport system permease subunit
MIAKIFDWLQSPVESEATISEWAAGLVLILIVSFLWSTVVRQID